MSKKYLPSLLFVVMAIVLLDRGIASGVSINILNPHEFEQISGEVWVSAKIEKDGNPFLEKRGLRWASAVLEDSRGVDSVRISLGDTERGEDAKPDDGIWTSLAKLRLQEGEYRLSIVVREDEQTFSSQKIKFSIVKGPPADTKITETKVEKNKEVASEIKKSVKNLSDQLDETNRFLRKEISSV